jgi:hypothetical protein
MNALVRRPFVWGAIIGFVLYGIWSACAGSFGEFCVLWELNRVLPAITVFLVTMAQLLAGLMLASGEPVVVLLLMGLCGFLAELVSWVARMFTKKTPATAV